MIRHLRHVLAAAALGSLVLNAGCIVAHSDTMTKVESPTALKAPADQAVVVFIRHTAFGGAILFTVIDENGKFLGVSQGNSHFAAIVPPGHHVFISGTVNNTSAVDATLAAGKVYFVEVSVRTGALAAAPELHAVRPGSDDWNNRDGWLKDTEEYAPNLAKGQHDMDDPKDRIKDGLEAYKAYDAEEKKHRTLVETDGI
jgi:hypothetical protein